MGKGKSKKGPPYEDDPECVYIVIDDPWPGNRHGKDRTKIYYDCLGVWVRFMLGKSVWVESIFSMNTRDEVIVKLPEGTDVSPILGAHRWREFLTGGSQADIHRVSYVFVYDYRRHGDPGRHNWLENFSVMEEPPSQMKFPVKFPYPPAHWATPRDKPCFLLVVPLPKTREPTPPPSSPPPVPMRPPAPQLPSQNTGVTDVRVHGEQNSGIKSEAKDGNVPSAELLEPLILRVDKNDPYEEEEAAIQFIKAEPVEQEIREVPVKHEEEPRQVSEQLMAAFQRLQQSRATDGPVPQVKQEPAQSQYHETSQAFMDKFQRLQHARAAQANVNGNKLSFTSTKEPQQVAAPSHHEQQPHALVKPEPIESAIPPAPAIQNGQIKPEPVESTIPPATATRDPRIRQASQRPSEHRAGFRVKAEPQDHSVGLLSSPDPARKENLNGHLNTSMDYSLTEKRCRDPRLPAGSIVKRVKTEEQ